MKARVLVLDDEPRMADVVGMVLGRSGHEVESFSDPEAALAALEARPADVLITDLRMPGVDGVEVLKRARAHDPELPVILMTAHGSVPTALEAMREGAFDYVQKPFDNDELRTLVQRALDVTRLDRENRYLRSELRSRYGPEGIVAESEGMRAALDLVKRAARSRSTVLISGESGTGKELVARAVHFHSDRVGGPFVAVNCKALAEGVLESELFGHERGAFTGADRPRAGLFERAAGGTLFLDEIGEVDDSFQAKLLRVLQERVVQRVGGSDEVAVDVRVVAATARDLRKEADEGRFREDLFFRLAVIPIELPPLRERREDVLPLARHFLERQREDLDRRGLRFGEGVEAHLAGHTWPGNVRELENVVERGSVLARTDSIELEDLLVGVGSDPVMSAPGDDTLQQVMDAAGAEHIQGVLRRTEGRRAEAARQLGVDRTTLYRLLKKYEIES
ncbi:MAG: sigma-54 dependent transcriptional regulator [Myxococcales bacterium]|nr:sigma-54 dependent transcriptional regulator [Myxococcales bacterium]